MTMRSRTSSRARRTWSCSTFSVRSRDVIPLWTCSWPARAENSSMRAFTSWRVTRSRASIDARSTESTTASVVVDGLGRDVDAEVALGLQDRHPQLALEHAPCSRATTARPSVGSRSAPARTSGRTGFTGPIVAGVPARRRQLVVRALLDVVRVAPTTAPLRTVAARARQNPVAPVRDGRRPGGGGAHVRHRRLRGRGARAVRRPVPDRHHDLDRRLRRDRSRRRGRPRLPDLHARAGARGGQLRRVHRQRARRDPRRGHHQRQLPEATHAAPGRQAPRPRDRRRVGAGRPLDRPLRPAAGEAGGRPRAGRRGRGRRGRRAGDRRRRH